MSTGLNKTGGQTSGFIIIQFQDWTWIWRRRGCRAARGDNL